MRVLVTRALEDGEATVRLLAARGHQVLLAPLLVTRFVDGAPLELGGVQAILATSANGVRALARRTQRRDVKLFAVGPQTAAAARGFGFSDVRDSDGDAVALARATMAWAEADKGALLHVTAANGMGTLARMLTDKGFQVAREILYEVTAAEHLPPDAAAALGAGKVDAALFFSPRSAAVFRDCVTRQQLATQSLAALCISTATAAALAPLALRAIKIAAAPNQKALLALLD